MKVGDYVERAARRWGTLPALHDESGTLTYAQLHEEVERMAAALRAAGLAPRAGLGLLAANGRGFLIGLFGALRCDAIVLPVSPQSRPQEILELVEEAGLHFLLDEGASALPGAQLATQIEMGARRYRLVRTRVDASRPLAPHIEDAAVVRFTSGTTGQAKGVVISHRSVMERIVAANAALGLGPGDTVVWVLPMAFHFVVSIILYVYHGVAIAVADDHDFAAMLACANRHRGTVLYASPIHIRLLAADESGAAMPSMRIVLSTTAGIPEGICRQFTARYGLDVWQVFGIIEVGLPILNRRHAARQPDAIGEALPGYEVQVLDERLQPMPSGSTGKLAIRGPGMFDGYLSPPLRREQVLKNGWFLTGDLASRDAEGVLRIEGREKSVINVAGTKVFPEEVEQVLLEHPAVGGCRVRGRQRDPIGEYVVAEIQLRPGAAANAAELSAWCRGRLSMHKVPRFFEWVQEIPRTATGKTVRG
jgi:acyl-coenzyme A synthetase/AMP-(fatty) acid ligase